VVPGALRDAATDVAARALSGGAGDNVAVVVAG
jgi:hypothetical protein